VLAADQRLRRADDFATVIRSGRRAGRGGLVVHLRRREQEAPARIGFVVPKAVGPAVTRNKVRRRLRHLVRAELARLAPGTDVVVRVLPSASGESYVELCADLSAALDSVTRRGKSRTMEAKSEGRAGRA
jgi:ribonuclease P protein component